MRIFSFLLMLFMSLSFTSCIETVNNYDKLPEGIWRGTLVLDTKSFTTAEDDEEVLLGVAALSEGEIPFNFEVKYEGADMQVFIFNGDEKIQVSEIVYGRNNRIAKDSFRFNFPEYDSYIKGVYEDNSIEGSYVVTSKKDYSIPFRASFGKGFRFTPLKKTPLADLSGSWECTFDEGTKDEYKAVGEFSQDGNKLTGTFRTETGDYRYLEGTVQGNKGYLSVFDGSHAFLFTMKIIDSDNLVGAFRSGKTYRSAWTAKRNPAFTLTNPKDLTYLIDENPSFDFTFPDKDGTMISLSDDRFQDKVKIISIMGTWCPNCKDEMKFLRAIKSEHSQDLEILAVSFERYREQDKALASIARYSDKMKLNFPMVHGGLASKAVASEVFPMLNKIISFPTIILLNKENEVIYVHTGFNGPATSKYDEFVTEFNEFLAKAKG